MATVKEELDILGRKITADAKRNALPNKRTGQLDKSFNYESSFISNDNFITCINYSDYIGCIENEG